MLVFWVDPGVGLSLSPEVAEHYPSSAGALFRELYPHSWDRWLPVCFAIARAFKKAKHWPSF